MNNLSFYSSGHYLGFSELGNLYSRDGQYLGWIEDDNTVWDKNGKYRGTITEIVGHRYILRSIFVLPPIPKPPKPAPNASVIPDPPPNVPPIKLDLGYQDAFSIGEVI
jgi:hypothetical protein